VNRLFALLALVLGVWPGVWVASARAQTAATANAEGGAVNFNFDQVELRLLVRLVGEMTGRRFVLDDTLTGKVTVVTPERIPVAEAYPLLVSILEASGFTVAEQDGTHRVLRLAEGGLTGAPVVTGATDALAAGLMTKVIRVQNISVVELRKVLEPLVRGGKNGAISAFAPGNFLIVTDTAATLRQIEQILAEIDRPGASQDIEVIALQHASADELAKQLATAIRGRDSAGDKVSRHLQQVSDGGGALPVDVVIVPAPQANSLVVVGTPMQVNDIRSIIKRLDVEPVSGYGRLHAVFLKYLSAEEAAKNLNALLAKTADKDQRASIALEHNVANNALIVDASPQDFEHLRTLVEQLDQIPQQVLVEVVIVEVSADHALDLGVQLSSIDQPKDGSTTFIGRSRPGESDVVLDAIQKGVYPQGLAVGVAHGAYTALDGTVLPNIPLVIQALARNRDVKILSNIPLLAQNNTEASVNVVQNIPILRSTIEGGSGTARDTIQNIDRLDVGIKLKLTPHVNPNNEVTLQLNPSIEAIIDEGSAETQFTPTIAKREVSTTITVSNENTVIISGLIREDLVKDVYKVPFLGDLPLIGFLFRSKSERTNRTNLLIFVTPHIVTDRKQADRMKAQLEKRSQIVDPANATNAPAGKE
jgi:general secretion pathway protein D